MNKLFDLNSKIAVVTGGYGHLGQSITTSLAEAGAKVIVAGRSKEKFNKAFNKFDNIYFEYLDLSNIESSKVALNNIFNKYGVIDIIVNNGFYSQQCLPTKQDFAGWNKGIDGVLNSVFNLIEISIPYLKKSRSARIINIASMYGMQVPDFSLYDNFEQFFNPPNYGTAKAGVIHLTKYYAKLLAKDGILVNAISPGPFPSENVQKEKGFILELEKRSPLKRIGNPSELVGIILLLASEASSYITGQNISVDGGWTI